MHVIRVPISAPTYGSVNGRSMTQRLGARFRGACSMGKKYNHLGATRPVRKCCPLCPGKRTYLPILELPPLPTLRERPHPPLPPPPPPLRPLTQPLRSKFPEDTSPVPAFVDAHARKGAQSHYLRFDDSQIGR